MICKARPIHTASIVAPRFSHWEPVDNTCGTRKLRGLRRTGHELLMKNGLVLLVERAQYWNHHDSTLLFSRQEVTQATNIAKKHFFTRDHEFR